MPLARHDVRLYATWYNQKKFLLTCLLRGMTAVYIHVYIYITVSTHMPLARHDATLLCLPIRYFVSTHMPLARHDNYNIVLNKGAICFYSHASCEAWLECRGALFDNGSFYSHASCEAWHCHYEISLIDPGFLLTCLLRGMTINTRLK